MGTLGPITAWPGQTITSGAYISGVPNTPGSQLIGFQAYLSKTGGGCFSGTATMGDWFCTGDEFFAFAGADNCGAILSTGYLTGGGDLAKFTLVTGGFGQIVIDFASKDDDTYAADDVYPFPMVVTWGAPLVINVLPRLTVQSSPMTGVPITGGRPGTTNYTANCNLNEVVSLTAPATRTTAGGVRWNFVKWTVDGVDRVGNPISVTMNNDHTAVAVYERQTWTLMVRSSGVTGVSITGDKPGTTNYSVTCTDQESVSLTAPAVHMAAGAVQWNFIKWAVDGDDKIGNPISVTMSAEHAAIAFYQKQTWTLAVQSSGVTGVSIAGDKPGTTNYTATCDDESTVLLSAPLVHTAAGGVRWNFVKWTVDGVDRVGNAVTVMMGGSHTAIATYQQQTWTLSVASSPVIGVAVTGTRPGTTSYGATCNDQESVTLTAPEIHLLDGVGRWDFVKWAVNGVDRTGRTISITMDSDYVAVAYYQQHTWTLSVQSSGVTGVSITGTKPGTTNYTATCTDHQPVSLTAPAVHTAAGGVRWNFVKWTVDGADWAGNPISVTVVASHTAVAVYQQQTWTLSVQSSGVTGVSITGTKPGTTNYGATCTDQQNVSLTAPSVHTAAGGVRWNFLKWTVDGADRVGNPISVTMAANHTATADYQLQTWTLSVQSSGVTGVSITGTKPGTTNYSATCTDQQSVSLDAPGLFTAGGGVQWYFVKWTVDGSDVVGNPISVTMSAAHTAVAVYQQQVITRTLLVQSSGVTGVSITGTKPGTTNYSASCTDQQSVSLTAPSVHTAAGGVRWNFVKWTVDGVDKVGNPISVTMDANHTATAYYQQQSWIVAVQSSGATGVAITGNRPGTTNYSAPCADQFVVSLTAPSMHSAGGVQWLFVKWTVDGADRVGNPISITMDAHHTAVAVYQQQVTTWTLSVQSSGVAGVSITGGKPGTTDYTATCADQQVVSLTAPVVQPGAGGVRWAFANWTVDGVPKVGNTISVTMDADRTAVALYTVMIPGDANGDCSVNVLDLIFIRNRLGKPVGSGDNWKADVNSDSVVNILDLIYARNRIGARCQ